ncbi:hypothetical protein BC835DRAFT_789033 [Cytidiella melzeri]|nr:hypothetical protein BC835DRAFT_789033 [Cytidiella melzeri]
MPVLRPLCICKAQLCCYPLPVQRSAASGKQDFCRCVSSGFGSYARQDPSAPCQIRRFLIWSDPRNDFVRKQIVDCPLITIEKKSNTYSVQLSVRGKEAFLFCLILGIERVARLSQCDLVSAGGHLAATLQLSILFILLKSPVPPQFQACPWMLELDEIHRGGLP